MLAARDPYSVYGTSGINPDPLLAKQEIVVARECLSWPDAEFTCDDDRCTVLDVAQCLALVAPVWLPRRAAGRRAPASSLAEAGSSSSGAAGSVYTRPRWNHRMS